MSIDLLQLVLLEPSPSTLDLLYLLDPGDEDDALIIDSMMRLHGYNTMGLDPTGHDSLSIMPRDPLEETSMRAANLHEIGEGLDSYAWSS